MEINKEEIIKGKSLDYARTLVIICLNIIAIVSSFIVASNFYVPIPVTLLCVAFICFLVIDFYFYEFHPDKIEITFPFKKAKNMMILKDEITSVLYNDQDRTGFSEKR
jgi:hypothetical protein